MDYKKIYDFIKELDKTNIEENKPQLMRYVIGLMLSIKEEDETKSLEDLEDVFDILLTREEFKEDLEKDLKKSNLKLGLLTEEFMDAYIKFTNDISENGYIKDAIKLTNSVLKGLGCRWRDVFLVKRNIAQNRYNFEYPWSVDYLRGLQEELRKHLNQDIGDMSKEIFNIFGVVEYIKNDLDERIDETIETIMCELRDKSLEQFNKKEDLEEYKLIFTKGYVEELNRRKYEWNVLSSKFKGAYLRDELYKDLED